MFVFGVVKRALAAGKGGNAGGGEVAVVFVLGERFVANVAAFVAAEAAEGFEVERLRQEVSGGVGVDFRDTRADAGGVPGFCGQGVRLRLFADNGDDAGHAADEGFVVGGDEALFGAGVVSCECAEMQGGFFDVNFAAVDVFAGLCEKGGGGGARQAQQDAVRPGEYPEDGEYFAVRVAAGGVGPAAFGEGVHVAGELVLQEGSGVNAGGFEDEGVVFHVLCLADGCTAGCRRVSLCVDMCEYL